MKRPDVIEKIRKLQRLATSPNAYEAAQAAAKARELMERHHLDPASLAPPFAEESWQTAAAALLRRVREECAAVEAQQAEVARVAAAHAVRAAYFDALLRTRKPKPKPKVKQPRDGQHSTKRSAG